MGPERGFHSYLAALRLPLQSGQFTTVSLESPSDGRHEQEIITVKPISGKLSALGAMCLAVERGPKHAVEEFEKQEKNGNDMDEFKPHIETWRARAFAEE